LADAVRIIVLSFWICSHCCCFFTFADYYWQKLCFKYQVFGFLSS